MRLNVILTIILTFPISPVFSFLWLLIYNCLNKVNNFQIQLFSFFGALIVGTINSNKSIEGDMLNYYILYQSAETTSFLEYLLIYGKDFFFTFLTYVLYVLTNGDFKIYIFILTASATFLLLRAISKFARIVNLNWTYSFFVVALTLLFYQIFEYSGHLIRQYLSICILFYGLSLFYEKKNKKATIWILISILSHLSSLIFTIPIVYKKAKQLKIRQLTKYLVFAILIFSYCTLNDSIRTTLYLMFYRVFNLENNIVLKISPVVHLFSLLNLFLWFLIKKKDPVIKSLSSIQIYLFIVSYLSLIISSELFIRIIFCTYFLFYFQILVLINQMVRNYIFVKTFIFVCLLGSLGSFISGLTNSAWVFDNLSILITPLYG